MPVASFVVLTRSGVENEVSAAFARLDGASVYHQERGKIIIISQTESSLKDQRLMEQMENIPGVLSVNLVYHNREDLEEKRL